MSYMRMSIETSTNKNKNKVKKSPDGPGPPKGCVCPAKHLQSLTHICKWKRIPCVHKTALMPIIRILIHIFKRKRIPARTQDCPHAFHTYFNFSHNMHRPIPYSHTNKLAQSIQWIIHAHPYLNRSICGQRSHKTTNNETHTASLKTLLLPRSIVTICSMIALMFVMTESSKWGMWHQAMEQVTSIVFFETQTYKSTQTFSIASHAETHSHHVLKDACYVRTHTLYMKIITCDRLKSDTHCNAHFI